MTTQVKISGPERFQSALTELFILAEKDGKQWIDVNSWKLHGDIKGYLGAGHKIKLCSIAMHAALKSGDEVLSRPRTGRGANLLIRYKLPR